MRKSRVTEEDRNAWANYLRAVRALPGRVAVEPVPVAEAPRPAAVPVAVAAPAVAAVRRLAFLSIGEQPAGIDNSSWNRLLSGKIPVARRLDLHSHTAEQAFYKLRYFLSQAHADGLRAVEIVTGRGSGPEGGVLRRELPLWLNLPDVRPLILGAAHPSAANVGAVLLLLRRPK